MNILLLLLQNHWSVPSFFTNRIPVPCTNSWRYTGAPGTKSTFSISMRDFIAPFRLRRLTPLCRQSPRRVCVRRPTSFLRRVSGTSRSLSRGLCIRGPLLYASPLPHHCLLIGDRHFPLPCLRVGWERDDGPTEDGPGNGA